MRQKIKLKFSVFLYRILKQQGKHVKVKHKKTQKDFTKAAETALENITEEAEINQLFTNCIIEE